MSIMSKGKYGDDSGSYDRMNIDKMEKEIVGLLNKIAVLEAELERSDDFIECLEDGGVDNWSNYNESLKDYWRKYGY